jgi:hypothetical protein
MAPFVASRNKIFGKKGSDLIKNFYSCPFLNPHLKMDGMAPELNNKTISID